ncbi:eIF2A-related protein [Nostoc sp. MS1]|uniref:WD40 domain-containing protein n=1 Tax=Nostoc sp. MS1 TaxID=2764711 RepID=UPI001CC3E11F|nr:ribosome assembly protein 4 [Nostoc sp. MS1]BCL38029.1 hypothetical protein NSMS1_44760 [Nostoc sp. MS1]
MTNDLENSDRSITQLAWAIENSVGQFKLILARCNYAKLRDRLITKLQEICQVEIRVLVVQQSHRTLYTAIQETYGENISGCVMVVGLEAVQNLAQMLTATNQVREEFREHFNFPLVVWIDDEIYQQFIQVAPDLESWAITKSFEINRQELTDFIITTANQWLHNQLNLSFYEYLKLETELAAAEKELITDILNPPPDLENPFPVPPSLIGKGVRGLGQSTDNSHNQNIEQNPNLEINAFIESLLGLTKQINNKQAEAIQHYQTALNLWRHSNNSEWQAKILYEMAFCAYLQAIKQQDNQHPAWQNTRNYISEYLQLITHINRPDIIANSLEKVGNILKDLKLWQQLKNFAQQSLSFHTNNNQQRELARDYSFLAEVALSEKDWKQAIYLIKQALDIIPTINSQYLDNRLAKSIQTYDLNLYKFILSRAQYSLGNTGDAVRNLETAKDGANPQEDVRLYIDILNQLQQFYSAQKQYLKAYNIKQQRRSIEQQFGLRAFVGAGRIEASRQTFAEIHTTPYPTQTTSYIAPEISASGRQLDVERLLERLNNDDYKLIVIHGQSGVGKSSLVNAGLVPALQQQSIRAKDNLVIVMRVYTNWVEELGRLLGKSGSGEWEVRSGDVEVSSSKPETSDLEPKRSSLKLETSDLEPKRSSLKPETSDLEPKRFSLKPETSDLEPKRSSLKPETSDLEPKRSSSKPETSDLEPERSSSKPESSASNSPLSPTPLHPVGESRLRSITASRTTTPTSLNPHTLLLALRENEQRNLRTVLVFDQFEEFFFVYTEPAQRKQFFEFLGSCLEVLSAKVILSLRVDYIHYLLECNDLPSFGIIGNDILSHRVLYKLGNFSPNDAKSIIQGLTANTSFRLEPALVDALVDDLAGELGEVRPIELQVVGAQLQVENITTLEKYRQFGTKQDLVQHYLNEVVYDCGAENQQLAEFVLFLLTDEKGTRPLKTRLELEQDLQSLDVKILPMETLGLTSLDLVLEIVVKSGLVVLLPENPADRYQLVHDYLANFIRQQQEPKLKQVMAELEKEREQRKQGEAKLNRFLKSALFGSVAAGIGLAIVTTLAVRSAYEAKSQKELAQVQKKQAEINEIQSLNNSSEAFLLSNQYPDALIEALKASDKLKHIVLEKKRDDIRMQTIATLQQAVYLKPYEAKENRAIQVNILEGHSNQVYSVAYSPNGRQLASASRDKTIKIWDISTGKTLNTLSGHNSEVRSIAYSPDGKYLASASFDKTIKIWNISTGRAVNTLFGHNDGVYSVTYSPDGKYLASASSDKTIKIWDISTGRAIKTLSGHDDEVMNVAYSPDGKYLASASSDKTIKIWDISTGRAIKTLSGHNSLVWSVAYSPDGKYLASSSDNAAIKVWDISTGKALTTLFGGHFGSVYSVTYSPDGKYLASAGRDSTIKIWDISTGEPVKTLSSHGSSAIIYSPDGQHLASANWENTIEIWDIGIGRATKTLSGHADEVNSIAYSFDGKHLASASKDKTIKIWDTSTGRATKTLSGHADEVNSVAYSFDGKHLASASKDKTIKIWDISTGRATKTLSGHNDSIYGVVYSPDSKQLASASEDKTIRIWDISTGKLLKILSWKFLLFNSGHSSGIDSVVYSPDGKYLASASSDKTIKIWDISTGKSVKTLSGHSSWVYNVVYSPDGKYLASASGDKTIKIWDISTGKSVKTLSGHTSYVNSVAYSLGGKYLASASWDKTIKIWDISTARSVKTLFGHSDVVNSVAYSPDGKHLASASSDNTIILWNLDLDNLVPTGCDLLHNYLIAHPEVLAELPSCQTPALLVPGATVLVIQGEKLARVGDIQGAVAKFRQAQQWDKGLNFDPEAKAKELAIK